jgi:hypothetical protein
MMVRRLLLAAKLATVTAALVLSGSHGATAGGSRMVYLRGPAQADCNADVERARARGDAPALFLGELRCKVQAGWKCATVCKGDELLVSHVAVKIQRDGKPAAATVVQKSESQAHDELTLKAVNGGAPFPAPPAPLLDGSGTVPVKIEFVCDCATRPK